MFADKVGDAVGVRSRRRLDDRQRVSDAIAALKKHRRASARDTPRSHDANAISEDVRLVLHADSRGGSSGATINAKMRALTIKWVVMMVMRPSRAFWRICHVERREYGSIPDVGSSRKTTFEPPTRAMHTESLRFWPPESCPAGMLTFSVRPTWRGRRNPRTQMGEAKLSAPHTHLADRAVDLHSDALRGDELNDGIELQVLLDRQLRPELQERRKRVGVHGGEKME